jgi:pre-mRNA-processing factor 40
MREASEDGASTTSRKRKEPHREKEDYRSERDHRHSYHDDYDRQRSSSTRDHYKDREYSRSDRDYREKDYKDYREYTRDSKDYYKSSRGKYESEREEKDRDRRRDRDRDRRREHDDDPYSRERDYPKGTSEHGGRDERERSVSLGYKDREASSKRDYDDRYDDRGEKVCNASFMQVEYRSSVCSARDTTSHLLCRKRAESLVHRFAKRRLKKGRFKHVSCPLRL